MPLAKWLSFRFLSFLICVVVVLFPKPSAAQSTFDAVTFAPYGPTGFAFNCIGWSFVPTADLLVTAVNSTDPLVMFWQGTNQVLATYDYTGPYQGAIGPTTNYQSIPPLLLSAGQPYGISTEYSNVEVILFYAYANNAPPGSEVTPFTNSSYISQYAGYFISTNGEWISNTEPTAPNSLILCLGPNFQFQLLSLSITNISIVDGYPELSIQSNIGITNQIQCNTDLSPSNWVVLTNLLVTQSPYSFVDESTPTASSRFYRVIVRH